MAQHIACHRCHNANTWWGLIFQCILQQDKLRIIYKTFCSLYLFQLHIKTYLHAIASPIHNSNLVLDIISIFSK